MDADTIPNLLVQMYHKWGDSHVAMRRKEFGIWEEYSWKDSYLMVKYLTLALISLGFGKGDIVCIMGDNDPEWFWMEYAAQAAGGAASGIYVDCVPSEVKYICAHAGAKVVAARDQEQVDKVIQIKDDLPNLKKVIYWDSKGMWKYDDPILASFDEMIDLGKRYEEANPESFERSVEQVKPDDLAVLCYTSGTTALPKGVMISHRSCLSGNDAMFARMSWHHTDDYVSFLSPAWITEQGWGLAGSVLVGNTVNFVEEPETAQEDIREISPQCMLYGSRQWESMASEIRVKMDDASFIKRLSYNLFLPVGYKIADTHYEGSEPTTFWKVLHKLGDWIVYRALRDKIGLSRTRDATSGGTYVGPDVYRYFAAIGVMIKNGYGLSETLWTTLQTDSEMKLGSAGTPVPGKEVRISGEGEALIRGVGLSTGYYKDTEATEEKVKGGWFHTGDAGHLDEDGHFYFLERVKDLMILASGGKFSPTYIESRLKFSPYIKEAMIIGDETKPFVTGIIGIDFDAVGKWAEKRHVTYTTFADLSQKAEVIELMKLELRRVNASISREARVQKFINLYKEFDPDEAELTRTRKLRRKFVEERYKVLVDAMYQDKTEVAAETVVKYQDGRVGKMSTIVKVATISEEDR